MRTIYKYPLQLTDLQIVELPAGSQILSVQFQHDQLCMWALVDTSIKAKQGRKIRIVGTGNYIAEAPGAFISTVQMAGGSLVWHIFDAGVVVPLQG